MFLACMFFKLILQETSNTIYVCLLFLKHKTRHCQWENSSIFNHKIYKEKFIKTMKLQMRKNESAEWKILKQLFNFWDF